MPEQIELRLDNIRKNVARMGELVTDMVRQACESACYSNGQLAKKVVESDDLVDGIELEITRDVIVTTMRHSPVAKDLLFLSATLGVIGELEKAGDDAAKLARRVAKLSGSFPVELRTPLMELGEEVRVMFARVLRLYLDYDDALAQEIIDQDQEIDRLYKHARAELIQRMSEDPEQARQLMRSTSVFHALEHIADHSVEIAKRLQLYCGGRAAEMFMTEPPPPAPHSTEPISE